MEEKYIESARGKTYYWVEKNSDKNAKNLFFLPGLTANHHLFDFQVPYFVSKYNVLTWDAPAHGKSRPYTDFSYPNLAEELNSILEKEGIDEVILIGQSAGGFVSQSFIYKYPHKVKGLFTIGTCPYGTKYYSKSDIFWLEQTKWMFNLFPDKMLQNSMAKMCGATEKGRQNMLLMLKDYNKKELCRLMYLGFAGFIPERNDFKLPCPVCLTVGEGDRTGKVMQYNKKWHEREGYPLYIINGAAHNANADKPREMNKIIESFIESI